MSLPPDLVDKLLKLSCEEAPAKQTKHSRKKGGKKPAAPSPILDGPVPPPSTKVNKVNKNKHRSHSTARRGGSS
jgi:hypothetical protein